MKRMWMLLIVFLLVVSSISYADFRVEGKIPAPKACQSSQGYKVTGLGWRNVGNGQLFVTTQCLSLINWENYVHLISPSDGEVLFEHQFNFAPAYCGAGSPHLTSGDHVFGSTYVVGDECGEISWITFAADTLRLNESADPPDIGEPSGMIYRGDSLFIVDRDSLDLLVVQVDGYNILGRHPLPCTNPSALAMFNGNLFVLCKDDSTHIYEMTTAGAVVDTHSVEGMYGCYPSSAVFVGSNLYVGGALDSILIFKQYDYTVPVAPGDSVEVEVVPDKVEITFDSVLGPGYVNADVFDEDPCFKPPDLHFLSDYYHISTTAALENISAISISDNSIGEDIDADMIRVFVRPTEPCHPWRDITVDSTEVTPILSRITKTFSEDDEFSVFALAVDNRNQNDVVQFKFDDLSGHLTSAEDSIPVEAYGAIRDLLIESEELFDLHHYNLSALRADSIAKVVRSYPSIPSIYDPEDPGKNVAGRLIARAHTLAFSIRFFPGWAAGIGSGRPMAAALLDAYPNPSGSGTEIEYAPVGKGETEIAVYSPAGRKVTTLFAGKSSGQPIRIHWDGTNEEGRAVAPGVYFVVAKGAAQTVTRKVIIQR
jgi:hypothetical protein